MYLRQKQSLRADLILDISHECGAIGPDFLWEEFVDTIRRRWEVLIKVLTLASNI